MAIYRNIHVTFWSDTKIVDDFTPEDKYFMLYCLTNNYTNLCGCYEISIKQMCRDLGYNEETVKKLLQRFQNVHKIIYYDENTKELFIKNWYKYNWTKSEKLDKPLLEEIKNIKSVEFNRVLVDLYNKRDTVSIPYTYPMDTTDTDTVTDTVSVNNKKKQKKQFEPPSLEDIKKYICEKKLNVDSEKFFNYFSEGNWIDSKGNKVKNWKQKLLTWNGYSINKGNNELKNVVKDDTQFGDLNKFYAN